MDQDEEEQEEEQEGDRRTYASDRRQSGSMNRGRQAESRGQNDQGRTEASSRQRREAESYGADGDGYRRSSHRGEGGGKNRRTSSRNEYEDGLSADGMDRRGRDEENQWSNGRRGREGQSGRSSRRNQDGWMVEERHGGGGDRGRREQAQARDSRRDGYEPAPERWREYRDNRERYQEPGSDW